MKAKDTEALERLTRSMLTPGPEEIEPEVKQTTREAFLAVEEHFLVGEQENADARDELARELWK